MSLRHTRFLRSINVHLFKMRTDPKYRADMESIADALTAPVPECMTSCVVALDRVSLPNFCFIRGAL